MAQSLLERARRLHKRVGCTVLQFVQRERAGYKFCFYCRQWKQRRRDFQANASRWDGVRAECKDCSSSQDKARRGVLRPDEQ